MLKISKNSLNHRGVPVGGCNCCSQPPTDVPDPDNPGEEIPLGEWRINESYRFVAGIEGIKLNSYDLAQAANLVNPLRGFTGVKQTLVSNPSTFTFKRLNLSYTVSFSNTTLTAIIPSIQSGVQPPLFCSSIFRSKWYNGAMFVDNSSGLDVDQGWTVGNSLGIHKSMWCQYDWSYVGQYATEENTGVDLLITAASVPTLQVGPVDHFSNSAFSTYASTGPWLAPELRIGNDLVFDSGFLPTLDPSLTGGSMISRTLSSFVRVRRHSIPSSLMGSVQHTIAGVADDVAGTVTILGGDVYPILAGYPNDVFGLSFVRTDLYPDGMMGTIARYSEIEWLFLGSTLDDGSGYLPVNYGQQWGSQFDRVMPSAQLSF
jgi:hypothetical protein